MTAVASGPALTLGSQQPVSVQPSTGAEEMEDDMDEGERWLSSVWDSFASCSSWRWVPVFAILHVSWRWGVVWGRTGGSGAGRGSATLSCCW